MSSTPQSMHSPGNGASQPPSEENLSLWDFLSTKPAAGSRCPVRGLLGFARPLFNAHSPLLLHWRWLLLAAAAVSVLLVLQGQP